VVKARFLDGKDPKFAEDADSRVALADWDDHGRQPLLRPRRGQSPWHTFFGIGIIDPIDEPSRREPPSHPDCSTRSLGSSP